METQQVQPIKHFNAIINLPQQSKINDYTPVNAKKLKKNKNKLTKFTYYKTKDGNIMKVLYINDNTYVLHGEYPFTEPMNHIKNALELGNLNPQRLLTTQAIYIGHKQDKMIVKKMKDIDLESGTVEIQTKDDVFQGISLGNKERFEQFNKILSSSQKAAEMSIRVIINETDPEHPQIVDYEFFFRQQELKGNKKAFK